MANIQSIIVTNVVGIVLLAILFITSYLTRERHNAADTIFTILILVCGLACVAEPATWIADGNTELWARIVNYLGNTYCYIANLSYSYIWVRYVDLRLNKDRAGYEDRKFKGLFIACCVLAVGVIANLFTGFLFTIDPVTNVYSRQPLSYTYYLYTFGCLFYSVYLKRAFEKENGMKLRFFNMALFLVPIFIGATLQAVFFGLSLAWMSVAIGLVAIHMSLQNELSYLDELTGLYNRTYLGYLLQSMERGMTQTGGVMIDLNFFKEINDNLGHSTGDEALKAAASILRACEPGRAKTMRLAGDEFIVLLSGAGEAEALALEEKIERAVDEFNETSGEKYKLSFSMGHAVFDPAHDTSDAFLKKMDEKMYERKRIYHAQHPEYARRYD